MLAFFAALPTFACWTPVFLRVLFTFARSLPFPYQNSRDHSDSRAVHGGRSNRGQQTSTLLTIGQHAAFSGAVLRHNASGPNPEPFFQGRGRRRHDDPSEHPGIPDYVNTRAGRGRRRGHEYPLGAHCLHSPGHHLLSCTGIPGNQQPITSLDFVAIFLLFFGWASYGWRVLTCFVILLKRFSAF